MKTLRLWAAAVLLALAAAPDLAAQDAKVLRFVPHAPLRITDPIMTTAYISRNHGYMIYDTLFALDAEQKYRPQMVERWTVSADKLTYTFTLRDGLKFHDGAPVTAEDCIASLERWAKRDTMGQKLLSFAAALKAIDAKTFAIVLKEPYGLVIESLGKPSSNVPFIMPKRMADTPADKNVPDEIGSGPFRFVKAEFQPGVKAVYVKNTDYVPRKEPASWMAGGKVVKVDRVEWITINDNNTAANALLRGEVDVWERPLYDQFAELRKSKDIVIKNHVARQSFWLRMNWLHPPFDNVKIRQAVLYALQQEDHLIAQVGDPAYYKVCGAMFTCGSAFDWSDGAVHLGKPDIEKAKQLLKEGGYKGEPVVILSPSDLKTLTALGPVTAQALRRIGMNVELLSMDWQTVVSRRAKMEPPAQGGWSIFHSAWGNFDLTDPVSNAGMNGLGRKGFFGWPEDAEMEALRDRFARETDPAKQKAIAAAIHKRAYDLVFYIPLGEYEVPFAYRSNIAGILDAPAPALWNIEKK